MSVTVIERDPEIEYAYSETLVDDSPSIPIQPPIELSEDADIDTELLTKTDLMHYIRSESSNCTTQLSKIKQTESAVILANVGYIYEKLARGKPISHICSDLGVSRASWYYVLKRSEHFTKMIDMAKQEHVDSVKYNLIKKTEDRYVEAEQVTPNGRVIKFKKYVPADFNAIKFFLLNKASDEFKEKQEIEIKKTNIVVDIIDDTAEAVDADYTEVK